MSDSTLLWPDVLAPSQIEADATPFSRSGGVSLGGIERSIKTDYGFWRISYKGVLLDTTGLRRVWNAIRTALGGTAGAIAIPVWSFEANGLPLGAPVGPVIVHHDDDTSFSDGSGYSQPRIVVEAAADAAIGDTSMSLRIVSGIDELTGVRFSHNHALYETGFYTGIAGDVWTVPVFPAVRAAIPSGAKLEFDIPTCLVHLATDEGMNLSFTAGQIDKADVEWIEAVDYWNDLAGA